MWDGTEAHTHGLPADTLGCHTAKHSAPHPHPPWILQQPAHTPASAPSPAAPPPVGLTPTPASHNERSQPPCPAQEVPAPPPSALSHVPFAHAVPSRPFLQPRPRAAQRGRRPGQRRVKPRLQPRRRRPGPGAVVALGRCAARVHAQHQPVCVAVHQQVRTSLLAAATAARVRAPRPWAAAAAVCVGGGGRGMGAGWSGGCMVRVCRTVAAHSMLASSGACGLFTAAPNLLFTCFLWEHRGGGGHTSQPSLWLASCG